LSCRDGALIHAGTRADRGLLETQMQALTQAGLPPDRAVRVLVAIGRMVVGWVLEEQAEGSIPPEVTPGSAAEAALNIMREIGEDGAFDSGLRMLIAGAAITP
jgi:TetR/AcrR family tetracycline transcriptional repressor